MKKFTGIDILRAMACCLVLTAHCCECYYISNFYANGLDGLNIAAWQSESLWAGIIGSVCRTCVPLFVVISGFLLLPMKTGMDMTSFYRRRASRILIPLAAWTVVYAFYTYIHFNVPYTGVGGFLTYIAKECGYFFINFPAPIGHLWYVYMILGLYLFIPILSPWVERATRGEMRVFLGIWLVTMLMPFIRLVFPELWGECYWNPNNTVYYFSGFIGYLVAGAYARKFMFNNDKSYVGTGLVLFIVGYATSLGGFLYQLYNLVPTAENYGNFIPQLEFTWFFTIITVCLETLGLFMMFFKWQPRRVPFLVSDFSRLSYGVYLGHIMILTWLYEHVFITLTWPTPCKIITMAALTICTSYALIKALSYVPKVKDIIG